MRWNKIKRLSSAQFRRVVGIKKETPYNQTVSMCQREKDYFNKTRSRKKARL